MDSKEGQLHIFFLPFLAPSHMIPAMDMARLFSIHGVRSTIVTTPANISYFTETIENHNRKTDVKIDLLTMKFPTLEAGLPEGYENVDSLTSKEMYPKFFGAIALLHLPFANLLAKFNPDCIVADFFFIDWANSAAQKLGIPCLSFHGSSYFSQCITDSILRYEPHIKLSSDSETFVVPGDLPHEIKLAKSELSPTVVKQGPKHVLERMEKRRDASKSSYGVIMNSFYELEPGYADYYEKVMGMKHWHIGPFSLYFSGENGENHRGKKSSIDASKCARWLDEKEPNSVIYICFGSVKSVTDEQLNELATALEASDQNFILVVKQGILEGFEERVKEKGLIIRGWAPQSLILSHESTGAFMTHCGWNSILEGVVAGLRMITWPQFAEQFLNEKLVTDVLKIGVQIGAKIYPEMGNEVTLFRKEELMRIMKRVMVGEEAQDMRKRAKDLKEIARMAISEGGSSSFHLKALIEELKSSKI